jgi:hypothetical protein
MTSNCRNQLTTRFQLANVRVTSSNSLMPIDRNFDPKQSIEPRDVERADL